MPPHLRPIRRALVSAAAGREAGRPPLARFAASLCSAFERTGTLKLGTCQVDAIVVARTATRRIARRRRRCNSQPHQR